jgi:hypothetical protein
LGVSSSDNALLYVILCPVGPYFPGGFKPVSLLADPRFTRAWPGGCGDRKMGSNYAPTIRVQVKNCLSYFTKKLHGSKLKQNGKCAGKIRIWHNLN